MSVPPTGEAPAGALADAAALEAARHMHEALISTSFLVDTMAELRTALVAGRANEAHTHARQLCHTAASIAALTDLVTRLDNFERGRRAATAPSSGQWSMSDWYAHVAALIARQHPRVDLATHAVHCKHEAAATDRR